LFLDHYGLREQPFGVTPDPRFLYFGASHREALASLYYGVGSGRGFLALIAKPGMGKTTLLFHLLGKLQNSARTAFLFQTQCDSRQFLRSLMTDLGVECSENDDVFCLQSRLNEVLVRETQLGRRFVLVVDEAQNLEDSVLETLRMLSNFETPRAKLMQIILAGQPRLAAKLASERLVQLRQRVSIVSRLSQLTHVETTDYIDHRLLVAGYTGKTLFTPGALERIASASDGIPRNINNLCFQALTLGFARGAKRIEASILEEVLADLGLESCGPAVGIEDRKADDPPPLRTAQPLQARAKRCETPLAPWTMRWRGAFARAAEKAQTYIRGALAITRRYWHQRSPNWRRAGAGLMTISTVCTGTWLVFSSTGASPQRNERVSSDTKSTNVSITKTVYPSVSHIGPDTRNTNVTRITRTGSSAVSKVRVHEKFGLAWELATGGDDRRSLKRLQTALKITPTPTAERQVISGKVAEKDSGSGCGGRDFPAVQVPQPKVPFHSSNDVSEDAWNGNGQANPRCASVDGKSARRD
jgi:type II secretory pathway predicted ATPase ExeA